MKEPVNDVQREFRVNLMAALDRLPLSDFCPDNELARQAAFAGFTERETQYIRRLVVVQIATVELMDRRVIDKRQADLGGAFPFAFEHGRGHMTKLGTVDGNASLRT